jgi:tetratricopeptide (TPR) repeat protein
MMSLDPNKLESKVELASGEVNLGVALVAERKMDEAIASFDRAAATFGSIRPRTRDIGLTLNQALGHKASALYAMGDNEAALATRRKQLEALSAAPLTRDDREVQEATAVVNGQIGVALLAGGRIGAGSATLGPAIDQWNELVALDPANKMWRGERNITRMWQVVARSVRRSVARAEMASIIADQRQLVSASTDWVHKENLLRMIAIDRAIGGSSTAVKEPIIAEAWARRDKLKSDDRAVLAAVLISEGDRLAVTDRRQAGRLWAEAAKILRNDESGTWALVHRARAARRLGQPHTQDTGVPPNAFAGIFAQGAGQ